MSIHHLPSSILLVSLSLLISIPASSQWLEFNAGASENSYPLVVFNGCWDELLTFDVELRGLLAETVTVDSHSYLRFPSSPGTVPSDEIGFPELPVVRRMVWLPDSSDITLEYSADCFDGIECLPIYPAPLDSFLTDSTGAGWIAECFRKDSSAYTSIEWYPDTLARLVGEFRLRDLRVGIVDVYPVQFLASEDSLRVWSDIEIALSYDTTADWPACDLGCYEGLIEDRLLGYSPEPQPWAPVPGVVMRPPDLVAGPVRVPDYVILVASGLDGWWVDTLAHHRADLNGFDVAIARTDSVLSQFGGSSTAITPDIIRDFTEAMWDWGSAGTKRSSYLLLIGDHEDPGYSSEDWFLPTNVKLVGTWPEQGSDGWFAGFGEPPEQYGVFPDMIIGRIPARTTAQLRDAIDLILEFESEVSIWPPPSSLAWRRNLCLLDGLAPVSVSTGAWGVEMSTWLGYSLDFAACGDGDPSTGDDGSNMSSRQWCDSCLSFIEDGAQVLRYHDHGAVHFFECAMDGAGGMPDSTFDTTDAWDLCEGNENHGWPFVLLGSCSQGTFNWTDSLQYHLCYPSWMYHDPDGTDYDFEVQCFGEALLMNTRGGAIGVFGHSWAAGAVHLGLCRSVAEDVLERGIGRIGDAISSARMEMSSSLWESCGWGDDLAGGNILGDPAVDIGDRVKFRNRCDLIISPEDIGTSRYPTAPVSSSPRATILQSTVRNAGAVESGSFSATMEVECGQYDTTLTTTCAGLDPGEKSILSFGWMAGSVSCPATLSLQVSADPQGRCPDSWTANNDATAEIEIIDSYPNEDGWPVRVPGSVASPPALGDVDGDGELEIVIQAGQHWLVCAEPDGQIRWVAGPYELSVGSSGSIDGYCVPSLGSVGGDETPELVVYTPDELIVLDGGDGDLLYSRAHGCGSSLPWGWYPRTAVLADLVSEQGQLYRRDEIAYMLRDTLYVLRVQGDSLAALDREYVPGAVTLGSTNIHSWVCACDLDGQYPAELIINCSTSEILGENKESRLHQYSYTAGSIYASRTFSGVFYRAIPAVGTLAGSSMKIALPRGRAASDFYPAYILDADSLQNTPIDCASSDTTSEWVLSCMIANWDALQAGTDRVTAPSANRAFSWEPDGDQHWFSQTEQYQHRPPFAALGDMDDDGWADLIISDRKGLVRGFDRTGTRLTNLGFPYTLPSELHGGFAIADIDDDGRIEVVFGTADNYLHVWELGECEEGYAPWPQCQHDAARTGALE
ncbi:MAG: C25 family cysteine peptidase [Candidatus Fermentibacter sp.]|nr:C25 family cysteine peptidase [Candidatus Fermentibacter sp.]